MKRRRCIRCCAFLPGDRVRRKALYCSRDCLHKATKERQDDVKILNRLADGVVRECKQCGNTLPIQRDVRGALYCSPECLNLASKARQDDWKIFCRMMGRCIDCGEPVEGDHARCPRDLERHNRHNRNSRRERRESPRRLCPRCFRHVDWARCPYESHRRSVSLDSIEEQGTRDEGSYAMQLGLTPHNGYMDDDYWRALAWSGAFTTRLTESLCDLQQQLFGSPALRWG